MKIDWFRLTGIRCFEDTGPVHLSQRCNIFVGQNNAGKSTLLRGVLAMQGFTFVENETSEDIRPGAPSVGYEARVREAPLDKAARTNDGLSREYTLFRHVRGDRQPLGGPEVAMGPSGHFTAERPLHQLVPFIARRKAFQFNQAVDRSTGKQINGTLSNLYSRIDLIATAGHPRNGEFQAAIREIVGIDIATQPSANGKEAGFYFDDDHFVTLERMGDGVSEMVGLIVEMCLERDKVFVLEEPETNLHPKGLKALLAMVRSSSERNQFVIATHSSIVVRELAVDETAKVFRVSRSGDGPRAPSEVEEVPRTPIAHRDLLRELGYEFADFDLHDGWLFLEEASAESVIGSVLIPLFRPGLRGRLRTFSARGLSNVEPSISDFMRLITFIHLEPAYRGRLWVRVDSDGEEIVRHLREKFNHLDERYAATFLEKEFEKYYPSRFREKADAALALPEKKARKAAKAELLQEVLEWSKCNESEALAEWAVSAKEQIELLVEIEHKLNA